VQQSGLGSAPILRFRTPEDWHAARDAFGLGNIWTAMLETLRLMAAQAAEMQVFGLSASVGVTAAIDPERIDAAALATGRAASDALAAFGAQAIAALPGIVDETARLQHRGAPLFTTYHDRCLDLIAWTAQATRSDERRVALLLREAMDGMIEPFLAASFAADAAPGAVSRSLVDRFRWSPPVWREEIMRSVQARLEAAEHPAPDESLTPVIGALLTAISRFQGWPALFRRAPPDRGSVAIAGIGELLAGALVAGWIRLTAEAVLEGYDRRRFVRSDGAVETAMLARAFAVSGGAAIYGDFLLGEIARYGPASEAITGRDPPYADVPAPFAAAQSDDVHARSAAWLAHTLETTPFINLAYARPAIDYLLLSALREAIAPGFRRRPTAAPPPHRGSLLYPPMIPNLGNAL